MNSRQMEELYNEKPSGSTDIVMGNVVPLREEIKLLNKYIDALRKRIQKLERSKVK